MLVILQGSLRHFPPEQLLPFLAQHHHSGTLDVEMKGRRARLFFRDGFVVSGESPEGNDATAVVASLFDQEAAFTFLDGVELPANAMEKPCPVDSLLEEARRRIVIGRTFPDEARFRVVEAPAGQEISLKPEQFKLLFRIGSGRTFGELTADGGAPREELAAAIRKLEASGLLLRIDSEAQRPAAAPLQAEAPAAAPAPEPAGAEKKKRAGALTSAGTDATVHLLIGNAYTIGRESGNDIVVPDASISSRHARISRTADGFAIEDLGSRNGTFVNGEPVEAARGPRRQRHGPARQDRLHFQPRRRAQGR